MEAYDRVLEIAKEAKTLGGVIGLTHWDQETYMPKGAANARADQLEVLSGMYHDRMTSDKFYQALDQLIDMETGQLRNHGLSVERGNAVKEWRRDFIREKALPKSFVQAFAKLTSMSQMVWQKAREEDNFSLFQPYLEKLVEMNREKAGFLGYADRPYDGLLDDFEPGLVESVVEKLFSELKIEIQAILNKIMAAPQVDNQWVCGSFDQSKQLMFSKEILKAMGYDFNHGRLDLSTHPFSTSFHPTDSRVTTRVHEEKLLDCLLSTLHEGGHSLYEMGLPVEEFGSPLCEPISLGMHESQSRFWETRIGQSFPFWKHFFSKLQGLFPEMLGHCAVDLFWKGVNRVEPSFIRVEADEVTYSLHVILRFEIEQALFNQTLEVKDIPEVWNQKMEEMLGITPPNNTLGCLQDVHWSMGAFGYFPTYTLGNLFAAHLFEAFEKEHSDWEEKVSQGDLLFIKKWLGEKVHRFGKAYSSQALLQHIYPKEFSVAPYVTYIDKKYQKVYGYV